MEAVVLALVGLLALELGRIADDQVIFDMILGAVQPWC